MAQAILNARAGNMPATSHCPDGQLSNSSCRTARPTKGEGLRGLDMSRRPIGLCGPLPLVWGLVGTATAGSLALRALMHEPLLRLILSGGATCIPRSHGFNPARMPCLLRALKQNQEVVQGSKKIRKPFLRAPRGALIRFLSADPLSWEA